MQRLFATLLVSLVLGGCSWADYGRTLNQTPAVSEGMRKVRIETYGVNSVVVPPINDLQSISVQHDTTSVLSESVSLPRTPSQKECPVRPLQKLFKVKTADGRYRVVREDQIIRLRDGRILIKE